MQLNIKKKSANNKRWRACGEKGTLLHCCGECKLMQLLWRTIWRFLAKLKIELPHDAVTALPGIYPNKTITQKDVCTSMLTAPLSTRARTWKQPRCPSAEGWIKKMRCTETMEYYSATKRDETVPLAGHGWT